MLVCAISANAQPQVRRLAAPAFGSRYVAGTAAPARKQGAVVVLGVTWKCAGNTCSALAAQRLPQQRLCAALAREEGALASFSGPAGALQGAQLRACNAFVPAVVPRAIAPLLPPPPAGLRRVGGPLPVPMRGMARSGNLLPASVAAAPLRLVFLSRGAAESQAQSSRGSASLAVIPSSILRLVFRPQEKTSVSLGVVASPLRLVFMGRDASPPRLNFGPVEAPALRLVFRPPQDSVTERRSLR